MLLGAMAAHADTVIVGHLYNAGQLGDNNLYSGAISLENLTNVGIHVSSVDSNYFPSIGPLGDVSAGTFQEIFSYGNFQFDTLFSFHGSLLSNTFTVGGVQYHAADATWFAPSILVDTNEPIYDIFVEAQTIDSQPVPEPGTMALIGTGLAGFVLRRRKA